MLQACLFYLNDTHLMQCAMDHPYRLQKRKQANFQSNMAIVTFSKLKLKKKKGKLSNNRKNSLLSPPPFMS